MLPRLAVRAARTDTFGLAQVITLRPDADGTDVTAQVENRTVQFRVNAPGQHMVLNALAALTAANALGVDGAAALAGFRPAAGRGLRRTLPGGVTLLDESYNANGASVRAALAVLRALPGRRGRGAGRHAGIGQARPRRAQGARPRGGGFGPICCSAVAR